MCIRDRLQPVKSRHGFNGAKEVVDCSQSQSYAASHDYYGFHGLGVDIPNQIRHLKILNDYVYAR